VLYVNGALRGTVPKKISLIAVEHRLEIRKDGYKPYRTKITPRPGFPQELSVTLKKKLSAKGASAEIIKAVNGYTLKLISPAAFTAGSSRREQGRRSNETLRKVILKRPFYMGIREVNNKEFRQFLTNHHSGFFKGHSLNREEHPVVQVTWQQAALFCNWLSEKEKLPPVYRKQSDKLVPKNPLPAGYRLPTETEWEYCARFANNTASLRYTWGDTFPPKPGTLNVADLSAKDLLSRYLEKYNDGHPVTAPVASYTANALGLFDLGGNAAEWCHDYYSIYTSSADSAGIDPTGPKQGKLYVIKGSSWQHASISTLRSAYRGYANDKRNDLGFRICRYAK
jgi:formylglycine-generating enzyme required for sulfatase activity